MLIDTRVLKIPSRRILEDLALRTGFPDREAVVPYNGMMDVTKEQFPHYYPAALLELLKSRQAYLDYDALKSNPDVGQYYKGRGPATNFDKLVVSRFEDIHPSWVREYLKNILTGFKLNNTFSINEFERNNILRFMDEDSEDGGFSDKSENLSESEGSMSVEELEAYHEKLPYLLKRLHEKSKKVGISLISIVIAYEKAKRKLNIERAMNKQAKQSTNVPPSYMKSAGVYLMGSNGYIQGEIPNTDHKYGKWLRWVKGLDHETAEEAEYYDNAMELLSICERLSIDIKKEDAKDFEESFISTLTITYVSSNKDINKRLNSSIFKRLGRASTSTYGIVEATENESKAMLKNNMAKERASRFTLSRVPEISRMRDSRNVEDSMRLLSVLLQNLHGKEYESISSKTSLSHNFYMKSSNEFMVFPVSSICVFKEDKELMFKPHREAIMHSSGFLILLYGNTELFFLDYERAIEYAKYVLTGGNIEDRDVKFGTANFGTWKGVRK